MVVNV